MSRTLRLEGAEGARNRGTPRGEKRAEEKPCGLEPRGREPTPEAGYGCLKESKGEEKENEIEREDDGNTADSDIHDIGIRFCS